MKYLLQNVAANATGTGVSSTGAKKNLVVWGTDFGGGTVTIQGSPDGGTTWVPYTQDGTLQAFTANNFTTLGPFGQGLLIRAVLSDAVNPVAVNAGLF
jgi:glutamate dehydrogenase/leucine dehydrogenase